MSGTVRGTLMGRDLGQLYADLFDARAINVDIKNGFGLEIHRRFPGAERSPFYLNLRTPDNKDGPLNAQLVERIGEAMWQTVQELIFRRELAFHAITGIPNAGRPLAKAMHKAALHNGEKFPLFELAKAMDGSMSLKRSEDIPTEGRRAIVLPVDDVISFAGSKERAAEPIITGGYRILDWVVFCDREQGGTNALGKKHQKVHSVCTVSTLFASLVASGRVSQPDCDIILDYVRRTSLQAA